MPHPQDAQLIEELSQQAYACDEAGDYTQAIALTLRLQPLVREAVGEESAAYADCLGNLGYLYQQVGDYGQAIQHLQQAAVVQCNLRGTGHPAYAAVLNQLGLAQREAGRYEEAETALRQAWQIRQTALGAAHPETADSLHNLGLVAHARGETAQAEALLCAARDIWRAAGEANTSELATTLNTLGALAFEQGRYAEAEQQYQQALALRRQLIGAEHPHFANVLNNLAELYRAWGRYGEAEEYYRQSGAIYAAAFRQEHPTYATHLSNLAQVYEATGRRAAQSATQAAPPVVIADPDYDLAAEAIDASIEVESAATAGFRSAELEHWRFTPLPGTRREGERIAAQLGVTPWLRETALEARLKDCRSPRILHLATHGFFLRNQHGDAPDNGRLQAAALENPLLRSGLALAGANTWLRAQTLPFAAEDGLLTAEDAAALDLTATELVVLSACETGLGEIQAGEGVFGLRRAFVLAGAQTLVMSLWKVPDEHTCELMLAFYERLAQGMPHGAALREAQLATKRRYTHPYLWGAFICQGVTWQGGNEARPAIAFQSTHREKNL